MTFKERLQIEHPEKINDRYAAGCMYCPEAYGYEAQKDCENTCAKCWNREIPVDDFKVGDKVKLRDGLVVWKKYDGVTLLNGMNFKGEKEVSYITADKLLCIDGFLYSPVMLQKVEEREEKKMKFNVGDKVRTTKVYDFKGNELFPLNTIGKIGYVSASETDDLPYRIEHNGKTYWYSDDMLEKAEFTKEDLKDGMLVEHRDGEKMIWLNGACRSVHIYCDGYLTDLTNDCNKDADIMKAGYPSKDAVTLSDMLEYDFSEIIWERKEEPVTKDVSLEELNALLKEKYPDVEKFNLPIKEK